jgi:DNA repair photolyase
MGLARIHNQDFGHIIPIRTKMPAKFANFLKKHSQLKFPVRISSNCDPFQPVEQEMQLTRKLLELCLQYKYPVVLNTKGHISPEMLELLKELNLQSLLQIQLSFITLDHYAAGILEPNVSLDERISIAYELVANGIPVTVRFQPIIPEVNSSEDAIGDMLAWCKSTGIRHLIVSFLRIKYRDLFPLLAELEGNQLISSQTLANLGLRENWDNDGFYYHPKLQFRERIVAQIATFCHKNNLFFSTCKEPFSQYHSIEDCCGGIYSQFSRYWTTETINGLPKNIQRVFHEFPRVQEFLPVSDPISNEK